MWRRNGERAEHRIDEILGRRDERPDDLLVPASVPSEAFDRALQAPEQDTRAATIERMAEGDVRLDPVADTGRAEEGRCGSERVYRRAHVMQEAGQRQCLRPRAPSDHPCSLGHHHTPSRSGELEGGREPVGACADDHGIETADGRRARRPGVALRRDGHRHRGG